MWIVAGQTGSRFGVGVGFDLGHIIFIMAFKAQGITVAGQEKPLGGLMGFMAAEALTFFNWPVHKLRRIDFLEVRLVAKPAQFVTGRAQLLGESRDVALGAFPVEIWIVDELARLGRPHHRRELIRGRGDRGGYDYDGRGAIDAFKKKCQPPVFCCSRAAG